VTAPLPAGRRAGLLRAAEFLAPAKGAIAAILALAVALEEGTHASLLARGGYYRTLVEKQARGLLPMAA
jgi:hypothetical protein